VRLYLFLLSFFLVAPFATGANHYIRAGSSGNGSDWANAWGSISSAVWTRDDTYYIASGTYPESPTISASGTSWLYIKKATATDHGTDVGWNSSYATGQAIIIGKLQLFSGNIDINGVTGSGNSGHGIKIDASALGNGSVGILTSSGRSYVNLSHIEVQMAGEASGITQDGVYCNSTTPVSYHHYSYLYIHDVPRNGITWTGHQGNNIIEHCYFYRVRSTVPAIHGQTIQFTTAPMSGIDVRYNIAVDTSGTAFVALLGTGGANYSDIHIYDNIIWQTDRITYDFSPGGIFGSEGTNQVNIKVYNNTWYNVRDPNSWFYGPAVSGNEQRNNLYINCDHNHPNYGTTSTNNVYYGAVGQNRPSGEVGQVNATTMPVVSAPLNFQLAVNSQAIGKGVSLGSKFASDIAGTVRALGSLWDAGAYSALVAPANLRIVP
jgi:hypothetical protein